MNLSDGEILLDQFKKLPDKAQQIFMAILSKGCALDEDALSTLGCMVYVGAFPYERCESPIEVIFELCYEYCIMRLGIDYFSKFTLCEQEEIEANGKKYRADFVIDTCALADDGWDVKPIKIVFECDGHNFHEKTKEQVARDNARDLDLKMAGYEVVHFSGSEIYNHPIECARKAIEFVFKKAGLEHGDV